MPLHPQVRSLLDSMRPAGGQPPEAMTVAALDEAAAAVREALEPQGGGTVEASRAWARERLHR